MSLFSLTSVGTDFLAFVWQTGRDGIAKREKDAGGGRVWQVRLHLLSNGYIVVARLLPLLSNTHIQKNTHPHC